MTGLLPNTNSSIARFVAGTEAGAQLGKPFEQPIYLLEAAIAGTTHIEGIDDLAGRLAVGDRLALRRERDNRFDRMAIRVTGADGSKLGYVPCDNNEVLARLMDGGKLLYGEVTKKELLGTWNRITMRVYLED